MQKKYGVNISYGKNTGCYFFNQSCVILENEDIINLALTNLEVYMKNYPDGFFKELNSFQGYRIILMSYLPDDSNGIAAFDWRDNRIYLKVNNNGVSEKTFHHENWHLMERYLDLKGEFMAGWDLYNPKGFSWGDISNNNYVQGLDQISKPKNISFQTLYGKTSATEDKAELFGYILLNTRLQYYNTLEYGINLKRQKLYKTIDTIFINIKDSVWISWCHW